VGFFTFPGDESRRPNGLSPPLSPQPVGIQKPTVAAPDGPEKRETSVTRCLVVGCRMHGRWGWVVRKRLCGPPHHAAVDTRKFHECHAVSRRRRQSSPAFERRLHRFSSHRSAPHTVTTVTGQQTELERRCLCPPVTAAQTPRLHRGAGFSVVRGGHTVTPPR